MMLIGAALFGIGLSSIGVIAVFSMESIAATPLIIAGIFVTWLATGPLGVGWLASHKGRDGALWCLAAFILPGLAFICILCAPEDRRGYR